MICNICTVRELPNEFIYINFHSWQKSVATGYIILVRPLHSPFRIHWRADKIAQVKFEFSGEGPFRRGIREWRDDIEDSFEQIHVRRVEIINEVAGFSADSYQIKRFIRSIVARIGCVSQCFQRALCSLLDQEGCYWNPCASITKAGLRIVISKQAVLELYRMSDIYVNLRDLCPCLLFKR